ncbi:MAG: zeta toxin family protein [Peptostreptococcaceae bacterium]|nr:zeta toxin family protein [Peptostreptococcaceae bacterium]
MKPQLLLFAGPNGSGKSTITRTYEDRIASMVYINADDIKKKYNLSDQEAFDQASRLRENCLKSKVNFSFETVFSHESKVDFMRRAKKQGYEIILVFVTTFDPEINKRRVEFRVLTGGHDVPPEKIVSRYERTMALMPKAVALADFSTVYNNSLEKPVVLLEKRKHEIEIFPQPTPSKWTHEKLTNLKKEIESHQMDLQKEFEIKI